MSDILLTGGTGTTGAHLAKLLDERGAKFIVATRKPKHDNHKRFEWADESSFAPALEDTRAVYLIAPIGVANKVDFFLETAVRQGVRRVVLLSSSAVAEGDEGMGRTHRLVRSMSPEWTVLRPSWFMQNFTDEDHPVSKEIAESGTITTATGDGRVGFVDAKDIAKVAAHALLDPVPHNTDHVITGPAALSYAEVAEILSVRHISISVAEQARRLTGFGYPAELAALLSELEGNIARGTESRVTDVVERVTGDAPASFARWAGRRLRQKQVGTPE